MTRSLVLAQAEEGEDGQNNDDQADEINQSMHAPLLNQWPEHKTAPKEESSGTAELGIVRRRTRPTSTVAPESAPDTIAKSAAPAHGDGQTGQEQNPARRRPRLLRCAQPRCLPRCLKAPVAQGGHVRCLAPLRTTQAPDAAARCRGMQRCKVPPSPRSRPVRNARKAILKAASKRR